MRLNVLKNNVPISETQIDTSDQTENYEIFVGRADDCHVIINDPLISRHHFLLKRGGSGWYCEKLTQLGFVSISGDIGSKVKLNNGDEIKCGIYSVIVSGINTEGVSSVQQMAQSNLPSNSDLEEPGISRLEKEEKFIEVIENNVNEGKSPSSEMELNLITEENILNEESHEDISHNVESDNLFSQSEENVELISTDLSSSFSDQSGTSLESFPDEGSDLNESTRVLKAFVSYQLVLFGEYAPYDRYQIDTDEIYIGRDNKKCQIILDDPEVSSVHAVLRKSLSDIVLEDLNSSNGTILNGERTNKANLSTGDEFVIGSTSFTLEVRSDLFESESDRLMPVEAGQIIEKEEIEEEIIHEEAAEIDFGAETSVEKNPIKRLFKNPKDRKKVMFTVAGIIIFLALTYDNETEVDERPKHDPQEVAKAKMKNQEKERPKIKLSKEIENRRNVAYELGVNYFEQNKYFEALKEFQIVAEIDTDYKKIQTYLEQTKNGLKQLEELEAQRRAEEERLKLKKQIEELLVKAREAVKEKKVPVAESYFSQIVEKDPENIELQQLKLELETWQKDEEKKALELAVKQAARKQMVDALVPGKMYYLKKEWYRAILKLEEFLHKKGTDEDLVKEASEMLSDAKNQLASELGPLLGKARSLKEGQDFKNAYEAFLEILKIEPTNAEALNEVDDIKGQLESRSKKIYREAIIAESLSLFGDAKEKFQEVQQISPTDSEYYKKATEKLKNYLE